MTRKLLLAVAFAGGVGLAGCDSSPSAPDDTRPQFNGRSRTTATTTQMQADSTQNFSGGNIGDPCDPATYTGPYRCVPDPNVDGGYVIAY